MVTTVDVPKGSKMDLMQNKMISWGSMSLCRQVLRSALLLPKLPMGKNNESC
jgi:hypothetical protein